MAGNIPVYDLSTPDYGAIQTLGNLGNTFWNAYDAAKKRRDEGDQRAAQDEQAKILLASLQPAQAVPSDGGATLGSAVAPQGQQGSNLPTFARVDNPPSATLGSLFAKYGEATGVSPNYLARTAKIESGYDPNAKNPSSSAGGLFQFIDGTAKQYGVTNKFDPEQATAGAARLAADNKRHLAQTLGRAPTDGELYLAHQQGAGGAARLLANPNARAADIVGTDAVRLNGGNPNETAGDFAARWIGKFNGSPPATASASPAPSVPSATIAQPARPAIDPSVQSMLQSANPYVRAQGIQLAQQALKPGSLSYQSRPDGSIVALDPTGKRAPQIVMQGTNNPLDEQQKSLNIRKTEAEIAGMSQKERTQAVKEYEYARQQGFAGSFIDYQKAAADAARKPETTLDADVTERGKAADRLGLTGVDRTYYMANGKVPTPQEKGMTEGQANAALYADRMRQAEAIFAEPAITAAQQSLVERATGAVPVVGNMVNSESAQRAQQAERNFINAVLRRESGAVISQQEYDNARAQYFPTPGDTPAVIKQKAQNRAVATHGIERAGGASYQKSLPAPTAGYTEGGYRFKGGSPADPASWEKVR